MMNEGMIYTLNKQEAEKEVEKVRAKLTPDQLDAYDRISSQDHDTDAQMIACFCILDRASKVDNCFYSMEAYRAIEAACYDAYMMGKLAARVERGM